jgi:hypothetical protein
MTTGSERRTTTTGPSAAANTGQSPPILLGWYPPWYRIPAGTSLVSGLVGYWCPGIREGFDQAQFRSRLKKSRCFRGRNTHSGQARSIKRLPCVNAHPMQRPHPTAAVIAACRRRLSLHQQLTHRPRQQYQLCTQTSGCLRPAFGHCQCCLHPWLLQRLQPAWWGQHLRAAVNMSTGLKFVRHRTLELAVGAMKRHVAYRNHQLSFRPRVSVTVTL